MELNHPIKEIIIKQKNGQAVGICSACSANEYVIKAVMERALELGEDVLIEATANQVNQFGGYTGMKPVDFKNFVYEIAKNGNFPKNKIILGGDHLGPLTWKHENEEAAMEKSHELIRQYVMAGFTKIHLDTSMHLGDDDLKIRLSDEIIADRGAKLCLSAEKAYKELIKSTPDAVRPVYVVGSEVPIPGGSQEEEEGIQVTKASDFENTVEAFRQAFLRYDLNGAWENVVAVVVQPGVEFGDDSIHEYNREAAKELTGALKKYPNILFEGHSTDYQTPKALKEMVEDGIAILKVGPALTFALREGLFALSHIENEIFRYDADVQISNFINQLDDTMAKNPVNWKSHYHGTANKIRFSRKYSMSDRCRYYLPVKEVNDSIELMIKNLKSVEIPLTLISEYLPIQYNKIRNGQLKNDAEALLKDRVINCMDDYNYATIPNETLRKPS